MQYWRKWEIEEANIDRRCAKIQTVEWRNKEDRLIGRVWERIQKDHPNVADAMRRKQPNETHQLIRYYMQDWNIRYWETTQKELIKAMVERYGE